MRTPILVAYATKHGSTKEVAEAIAAELRGAGHDVALAPAVDVDTVEPYSGVVLGGALYTGRWHRAARAFIARHAAALANVPLAVFALGPIGDKMGGAEASRTQLDGALARTPQLEPVSVAVFGGVIVPERLRFPLSRMPAADERDWAEIRRWALAVAQRFAREPSRA